MTKRHIWVEEVSYDGGESWEMKETGGVDTPKETVLDWKIDDDDIAWRTDDKAKYRVTKYVPEEV